MKKALILIVLSTFLLTACLPKIKQLFCSLNFSSLQTDISGDINYINGRYDYYVGLLKSGDEKVRPWVVAADLALAQLVPLLQGLQQGVCYPITQVQAGMNMAATAKAVEPKNP